MAATTGFFVIGQQLGELKGQVAASEKAISDAKTGAATIIKAYEDASKTAVAATEAKLVANEKASEAKLVASWRR